MLHFVRNDGRVARNDGERFVARLQRRADLQHGADQHAARAGDRVVVLAALRDDGAHGGFNFGQVAFGLGLDLGETGSVDVERADLDQDLVVPDLHVVVDLPGALRQHALGFEHAVDAIGGTVFHASSS